MHTIKGLEHLSNDKMLGEVGLFSPEKEQRGLINVYKYLMGKNKEERDRFFTVVTRTRGSGRKLKRMKFHLNAS